MLIKALLSISMVMTPYICFHAELLKQRWRYLSQHLKLDVWISWAKGNIIAVLCHFDSTFYTDQLQ